MRLHGDPVQPGDRADQHPAGQDRRSHPGPRRSFVPHTAAGVVCALTALHCACAARSSDVDDCSDLCDRDSRIQPTIQLLPRFSRQKSMASEVKSSTATAHGGRRCWRHRGPVRGAQHPTATRDQQPATSPGARSALGTRPQAEVPPGGNPRARPFFRAPRPPPLATPRSTTR